MKLFEFAGIETEWVAAHDEDEARQLLKRHYGIGDDDIASSYESVSEVDAATVEFYVDGASAVDEDDDCTPTMTAAEMMAGKTKPFVVGSTFQ